MRQIRLTEARLRGMILEATRRAIMMEERGEETDSKIRELISFLHNAQKPVREIHWNTNEYALHMVTDETIGDLCEWEDGLAEAFLGDRDIELKISDRKPSSDTDFKSIINELVGLASDVKESVSGNKDYDNVCAVLDEILETGNQLLYKSQLK
jgi:DNA-binding ferritin-like protein